MSKEDESVVDVGNMGLVHIERQLEFTFQERPAFFADGLRVSLRSLDNDDKVIGISAVSNGWFPLPILANRNGPTLLDAEVQCPAILSSFRAQVPRLQPLIKLMEQDVRQKRRDDTALRHPLACGSKQATIDVFCLEELP